MRVITAVECFPIGGSFVISRGAKTDAVVVLVAIEDGACRGRGEAVPYAHYGESVESVLAQIASVRSAVEGGAGRPQLQTLLPPGAARNAIDCALWEKKRLFIRPAKNLDFCVRIALKSLDEDKIDWRHEAQKLGKARLVSPSQLMHERETAGGGDEDFAGASLAMEKGILAWLIDIERMMRVFKRRDRKALFAQIGDELDDQSRLARAAPTCNANHPHYLELRKALPRANPASVILPYAKLALTGHLSNSGGHSDGGRSSFKRLQRPDKALLRR